MSVSALLRVAPIAQARDAAAGCGYVKRFIRSIRRELLDHVIVFGEGRLRRLLHEYTAQNDAYRTHLEIAKDTPQGRPVQNSVMAMPVPRFRGLHHAYVRM